MLISRKRKQRTYTDCTPLGMPDPLDESLVSRKRKAAPPAAEAPAKKKRSRIAAREAKEAKKALVPKTRVAGKPVKPTAAAANGKPAAANATKANGKPVKKSKAPAPPADDDDVISDNDYLIEDSDEDGNINVTGLDALGSASEDELDDDAFDSDEEITKGAAMWSDDDDDEDLEERLTAANIEGLSKKLDMEKAVGTLLLEIVASRLLTSI
jgi:ribosomal RNA methyltransferase Nop2